MREKCNVDDELKKWEKKPTAITVRKEREWRYIDVQLLILLYLIYSKKKA